MEAIGKFRSGIKSIRPWLGKVNGYREIVREFFGKAANKAATIPFVGDMAKRAVEKTEEAVMEVAEKAKDVIGDYVPETVKTIAKTYLPANPIAAVEKALDIADSVAADLEKAGNGINKWAKENPGISNMLLDKPLNYSSVIHAPGPQGTWAVENPRQNVVGKAKKVVMATPNLPRVEPAGPSIAQMEMVGEMKRFARRGAKK